MLDTAARRLTAPPLDAMARHAAGAGIGPTTITAAGWFAGIACCGAIVAGAWPVAIGLWLLNRVLDGLDGAVARLGEPTDLGGFLDILADFSIYGGVVLAVAIEMPEAQLACAALLVAYYVSGTAFLALSSILERRRAQAHLDQRSLRFVGGLAEGTETVLVYVALMAFPGHAEPIVWIFVVAVTITALQRTVEGVVTLRSTPAVRTRS